MRILIKSIKFGLILIIILAGCANAQLFHYSDGGLVPEDVDWMAELSSFCASLVGDEDITPLYVHSYLDGVTGTCRSKCIDGLLLGEFDYVELAINRKSNVETVNNYSFSPANGRFRLERYPHGHHNCHLFDRMRKKQLDAGIGPMPRSELSQALDRYCIGVREVDKFQSTFGVRRTIQDNEVRRSGEEIYNLKTGEIYAARYEASFKFSAPGVYGKVECANASNKIRKSHLTNFIKPIRKE
ncbi:hypothetical protein [Hyphococcus luteus]|uniref:hypothetical protein n=1 Tax=Hyphococcus luteus TaxID=2058213 RepID=UPI0010573396|nr:hypothetical protein [Marinicaulis flavus]